MWNCLSEEWSKHTAGERLGIKWCSGGWGDFLLLFSHLKSFSSPSVGVSSPGLPTVYHQINLLHRYNIMKLIQWWTLTGCWRPLRCGLQGRNSPWAFHANPLRWWYCGEWVETWWSVRLLGFGKDIVRCFHVLGVNTSCITPRIVQNLTDQWKCSKTQNI